MRKYLTILLVTIVFAFCGCSPKGVDHANIIKSRNIINAVFKNNINADYFLYKIRDKYIIVANYKTMYQVYYISEDKGIESVSDFSIEDPILHKIFHLSSFKDRFVYSADKYTSDCPATYIYVHLNIEGKIVAEFNLPSMLLCSDEKVDYPIDEEILNWMFMLVNTHWY